MGEIMVSKNYLEHLESEQKFSKTGVSAACLVLACPQRHPGKHTEPRGGKHGVGQMLCLTTGLLAAEHNCITLLLELKPAPYNHL